MDLEEVVKLLTDLEAAGLDITPTCERSGMGERAMRLRATSGTYRGRMYDGEVVAGFGGTARLVVAGLVLRPTDCAAHSFTAVEYTATEIEVLDAAGYEITKRGRPAAIG